MFEFNATLIAQIVDFLLFVLVVVGITALIFKVWASKKKADNKIEKIESELKEIKKILEEIKGK